MKKTVICISLVIIFGIALLGICYYRTNPFLSPTYYDGIYVDLAAQADYEAWLKSDAPSKQSTYILKVDKKTEFPVCMELTQGDKTTVCTSFFHNGVKHDLRFENNVLVGARRSYSEEKAALAAELGASWDALSAEQQKSIDRQAFEIIWNDQSWDTDPEILKPILEDYVAQVQALSDASHSADQEN